MKIRKSAKIGTHSSSVLVLWNDKEINIGDVIVGMPADLYDSLHSSYRRLKICQYWEEYKVTNIDPILFINKR